MIKSTVTTCDIVQDRLNYLHTVDCMPWRKIANLDDYSGIPAGTLASIAKGHPIPRKWKKKLGVQEEQLAPVCPRCNIVHLSNRCPKQIKRYGSGATVVIRGVKHEVVTHKRMDSRPFAPVLVVVE